MKKQSATIARDAICSRAIRISMIVSLHSLVGWCAIAVRWFLWNIALGNTFWVNSANAQITPDASLGNEASTVTPNVIIKGLPADRIDGGARRGANLFHSFSAFNVGDAQRVYFANPTGVENILTRVTGGKVSNILGTLGVNGSANLFLVNPSGILFGENARLDVGGSFVGSTANGIQFGEGDFFSATNPETPSPLLTVNPSALFFHRVRAGRIENRSLAPAGDNLLGLRVPDSRSLLLVGGDILMNGGRLNAPGGRVELAGIADNGTVGLNVDQNNLSLTIPDNLTRADISLTNNADVDVTTSENGGFVKVNARNLELTTRSDILAGIKSGTGTPSTQAGDIEINVVEQLSLNGSRLINIINDDAIGIGGNIYITTGNISASNVIIATISFGTGNAGNLSVQANNSVFLDGARLLSFIASREVVGNSGNINISSNSLQINNSRLDSRTFGQGNAGNVSLLASDSISIGEAFIFTSIGPLAVGKGGDINIRAASLSVKDGAQLVSAIQNNRETSTLLAGRGNAGNININVTGAVTISGVKTAPSGLFSLVSTGGVGNGGNINISANSFSLLDGANIFTNTNGEGSAGNIKINATDLVNISGTSSTRGDSSELSARTNSSSNGGDIIINTRNFSLANGGVLNVQTVNNGNGGKIEISAKKVEIVNGGQILSNTSGNGNAGNIQINATQEMIVDGIDKTLNERIAKFGNNRLARFGTSRGITNTLDNGSSGLFVSSESLGSAGDIEINSPKIQLDNTGRLIADSTSGNGGNITIGTGKLLLMRRGSLISTSAGTAQTGGNGGNITINASQGFLVAIPKENSDITANAFSGSGGKVDITTQAIFGLVPRSREELQTLLSTSNPTELNPNQLPSNDITAISQENPSLSGQVSINTPDVDPSRGLSELPENIVDAAGLINQNLCTAARQGSEFIVTGRGGLPVSPSEFLNPHATWEDWNMGIQQEQSQPKPGKPSNQLQPKSQSSPPIIE
nr:S-layer family protein [Calothrix sp. MO_192.B10]